MWAQVAHLIESNRRHEGLLEGLLAQRGEPVKRVPEPQLAPPTPLDLAVPLAPSSSGEVQGFGRRLTRAAQEQITEQLVLFRIFDLP